MVKKHKLDAEISGEHLVIGISSQLKDYRLCHFLNEALGIKLTRSTDIPVVIAGTNEIMDFPFYRYYDLPHKINWYLLANRNHHGHYMLADLKVIDFLLINDGLPHFLNFDDYISTIKKISQVRLAQEIGLDKSKGLSPLLLDLEMHLVELDRKLKR